MAIDASISALVATFPINGIGRRTHSVVSEISVANEERSAIDNVGSLLGGSNSVQGPTEFVTKLASNIYTDEISCMRNLKNHIFDPPPQEGRLFQDREKYGTLKFYPTWH